MCQCQPTPSPLVDGRHPAPLRYAMQLTRFCPVETKGPTVAFESQGTILSTTALAQTGLWEALSPGSSQLLTRGITQGLNRGRGGERGKVKNVFP